ncbi:hypothetical protein D3C81_1113940 [compost metagenome]
MTDQVDHRAEGVRLDTGGDLEASLEGALVHDLAQPMAGAGQHHLFIGQFCERHGRVQVQPGLGRANQDQVLHHYRFDSQRVQWLRIVGDGQLQLAPLQPVQQIAAERR